MIPKEQLRWYLYEETIEIFKKNGAANYEKDYLNNLKRFLSYYYIFKLLGIISKTFYKISKFNNKNKNDILVHDLLNRYPNIIDQVEENYSPLFFGINIKPSMRFLKGKYNYYSLYDIYKDLYNGILDQNDDLLENSFICLGNIFRKINPKVIVLSHENSPETKLITLVARELRIPTIEIQHGAYSGQQKIFTSYYTDYVFVWGEYFKNLYLKFKVKKENQIRVLGYPIEILKQNQIRYNKRVVYLGQPLELYDNNILNLKKDVLKKINSLCNELGFHFIYRPHYGEDINFLKTHLQTLEFCPNNEKLEDTIRDNDIFISFNSTALIEAALNHKISIQLKNYDVPTDDFEKLGICRTFNTINELKAFLKELNSIDDVKKCYSPVDPSYIEIPSPNPGEKFLELLNDII